MTIECRYCYRLSAGSCVYCKYTVYLCVCKLRSRVRRSVYLLCAPVFCVCTRFRNAVSEWPILHVIALIIYPYSLRTPQNGQPFYDTFKNAMGRTQKTVLTAIVYLQSDAAVFGVIHHQRWALSANTKSANLVYPRYHRQLIANPLIRQIPYIPVR